MCSYRSAACVKLLLDSGADANHKNIVGFSKFYSRSLLFFRLGILFLASPVEMDAMIPSTCCWT